jgi:hypothetical protein
MCYAFTTLQGILYKIYSTTPEEVKFYRSIRIKYLVTTTPVLVGRSFCTYMMKTAIIAVCGMGRSLANQELKNLLNKLGFEPQIQELN